MYPQYMCILLYVKLIWCNGIPYIYCQLVYGRGYMYPQYICILLYVTLIWCNVFYRFIVNWSAGYMYPQYMCILLYVKLIW